jgi:large subunit ribosomal protein L7Ae
MTKTSKTSDTKKTAPAKSAQAKTAPAKTAGSGKHKEGKDFHAQHSHLFAKDARDYRVGRDIQPKRDLSRYVKWPRYVRIQRQRAILKKRLKVPPAINQFTRTLEKNSADLVFKLLKNYTTESRETKRKRLIEAAKAEVNQKDGKSGASEKKSEKPMLLKYGINHITTLIEQKKAKLVVIAHDVDPIEIVVWLPALCRKMDVPYCIVKGKARLGLFVHKKSVTAVALTEVRSGDASALAQVVASVRARYDDSTAMRKWGGGIMGTKAQAVIKRREKLAAREASRALGGGH